MESAVQNLLETFRGLPDPEKHQVVTEILHWVREASYPPLKGEEFAEAAAGVLRLYDEEE
jgi:hypothetical protein